MGLFLQNRLIFVTAGDETVNCVTANVICRIVLLTGPNYPTCDSHVIDWNRREVENQDLVCVFINHSQEHSLSFYPRFCEFESSTTYNWLNHTVWFSQ